MNVNIELIFEPLILKAEILDTAAGREFLALLPVNIFLNSWGDELYGPLPRQLSQDKLQETIPPGGLAYSPTGTLFCIFFGQTPAWPVELIGSIHGEEWKKLKNEPISSVHIKGLNKS